MAWLLLRLLKENLTYCPELVDHNIITLPFECDLFQQVENIMSGIRLFSRREDVSIKKFGAVAASMRLISVNFELFSLYSLGLTSVLKLQFFQY